MRSLILWASLAATFGAVHANNGGGVYLAPNDQEMFDESMTFMDQIYDSKVGYLYDFYGGITAGTHETRASIWYACGLLQRNQGDDYNQAVRVIRNIIDGQHKDPSELWFGDYQVYPEEATVDLPMNPQVPYSNWDPNWRPFIGDVMIIIYEEYGHMLDEDLKDYILESMYNVTLGDTYRNAGSFKGGLNPGYSNPSYMRAIMASWTGRKLNDQNLTDFGENWGQLTIDNFDMFNTLAEFNSGTYSGVAIWALTMWAKYSPDESILKSNGVRILQALWDQLASSYNANLRNLAGPWDRSYGFDMNLYYAITTTYIWSFVGREAAPVYPKSAWAMVHADDFEYTPVIAVLADFHNSLVSDEVKNTFKEFPGDHWYNTSAFAPPKDQVVRNISTWNSANFTLGVESYHFNETESSQLGAAVAQWLRYDNSVGYFSLFPEQMALQASIGQDWMDLTYPAWTNATSFTFMVSTNPYYSSRDILSLGDVVGINISVSGGNVDPEPVIGYCGQKSGTCDPKFGFEFWNYTFVRQEGVSEPVNIHLNFALE